MSKGIKTKTTVKDIKVLDKVASGTVHVKNAIVHTKDSAVKTQDSGYQSANDYATDKSTQGAQDVTRTVAERFKNPKQKAQQNVNKAKEHFKEARQQTPKARKGSEKQSSIAYEKAKQTAENTQNTADKLQKTADSTKKTVQEAQKAYAQARQTARQVKQRGQQAIKTAKQSVRTTQQGAKAVRQTERTIKTSAKSIKATGKGTIKATQKTVKTAQRTAKTAVKTAKHTAKAAQQSAKVAAKAAKASAQAAKAAVATAKAAVKVTIAMVKAAIAAIKGLVALIAAGGWIAVLIIIIICLIGLLVGSIFGIFFSGEDAGSGGRMMPDVVSELTTEFYQKSEDIKNRNTYDVLDMDAMSINWPEVLSVYAVKVNSDPENPAEVATLNDDKVAKLKGVLEEMVSLSHSLKTETQERTVTTTDENGNETETTESVSVTTLTITLNHKTADEMATQYGFSSEQKEMLAELLSPEYNDLWSSLLGGYSMGTGEIFLGDGSRIPKDIFDWPIGEGFSITSNFGYRKDPFDGTTKYHGGTDIGAPEGTPVLAAADGIVIVANSSDTWGGGWGYYVKIKHNDTYSTLYAHCSRIAVTNGQEVKKGQAIAYVGTTGNSTGNHLHFEVYKDEIRTNPLGYFN